MKFPHLDGATPHPGDDAHMWTPKTKIKLCRVKWRDDMHDVVKFKDDATRDAWFDALDGETVTLTTNMYIARADVDGVKIPVPYMTAQRYNYIVVDFSADILQSPYQKTDAQTRYHYFVSGITAEAPNTTTVVLTRDVWADYINTITINGLLLTRGHAPLTETTPAKLLENPRENSTDMLAPDVNYGTTPNRITGTKPVNLTDGVKYICFACTFDAAQLASMTATRGTDITGTDPTYSGDAGTVTAWTWGAGGIDVGACRTLGNSYESQRDRIPNSHTTFALRASDVTGDYINELFAYYPHIANGIAACFVLSETMLARGASQPVQVNGVAWQTIVDTERTIAGITLSPDDFDMPDMVRDVTRLYVSPYSVLEITDTWGKTVTVNIEDCGPLSVRSLVSTAYPLIRQTAYLDGVGANGVNEMDVTNLSDQAITGNIPNADVLRTVIAYDIPTYALQRRNIDAYRGANYNRTIIQGRENAITAYENAAQSANVGRSNTQRSNAAAASNTTVNNNARTSSSNENQAANTAFNTYATTRMNDDLATNTKKLHADTSNDVTLMNKAYIEGSETQAISNVVNNVVTAAGAIVSIATAPATGGASLAGAAMSIGGAVGTSVCTNVAITNSLDLNIVANNVAWQKEATAETANTEGNEHAKTQMNSTLARANTRDTNLANIANTAATTTTANNVNASNANATASRDQAIANAKRSTTTTRDNATNTFADMYNQPAAPVGAYSGDPWADEMAQRDMVIKVRTQAKGALLQAGMHMLRYGIASNKLYSTPNLTPCRHFTYWQASDVWLTCDKATNETLDAIRTMLTAGVTIWADADEIGGDYLTDNIG
jgi:hypothetical protein|nr:MAG TPA: Major tail protein [Bacteriophage sp.]